MSNKKYKNHGVPNIPIAPPPPPAEIPPVPQRPSEIVEASKPPPPPPRLSTKYEYETYPMQLGLCLSDAKKLIEKRLNECAIRGYRYCDRIQVNISEAILIFEKAEN